MGMPNEDTKDLRQRLTLVEHELAMTVQELTDTYEEISAIYRFSETLGVEINTDRLCEKLVLSKFHD